MQLSWRRIDTLRMPRPTFSKPQAWIGKVESTSVAQEEGFLGLRPTKVRSPFGPESRSDHIEGEKEMNFYFYCKKALFYMYRRLRIRKKKLISERLDR